MKTKFIFMLCVATAGLSVAGLSSCTNDGIPEKLEFEQFKYLYLLSHEGAKEVSIHKERDSTFLLGCLQYGGTTDFRQGEISAAIGADMSLVEAYNADNGAAYLPLPADCYSLGTTSLVIEDGKNGSENVTFTLKNAGLLDESAKYLLPVTVQSVNAPDDLPLNEERKVSWWIISVIAQPPAVSNPEKDLWSIDSYSTQWNTQASSIIDGDRISLWHTDAAGTLPQWVIINFSATATVSGIVFTNRQSSNPGDTNSCPKHIKFEISDTKASWALLLDVAELPNVQEDQTLNAPTPLSGKYMKITIETSWSSPGYSYIGEVDIF
ncbi:MAG: DUF1735 domain-containing protein [Bacteroidales bacterium]|jgi:hypothetical protein|nr:DUF1735 domain-containing protein [Bacteroidales bacterium]